VSHFWWQAAALFWAALCLFRVGASLKRIHADRRMWLEICQAAAIVVVLFALLTGGRGCRMANSTAPALECLAGEDC